MFEQNASRQIVVSGDAVFQENEWRKAIHYFLFGIWGDKKVVMKQPTIAFGDIVLCRCKWGGYRAYGTAHEEIPNPDARTLTKGFWHSGHSCHSVEIGLIRFVSDEKIRNLRMFLADETYTPESLKGKVYVELWKKQRRGQYGCGAQGITPENKEYLMRSLDLNS